MAGRIEFTPIGVVEEASGPEPGKERFFDREERIRIFPEFVPGLTDLAPGDRIMILFHFHLSRDYELVTFARGRGKVTGVFNSHSPRRPNGIGADDVVIKNINGGEIVITGGDMLPGTPILDIKPCMNRQQ